MNKNKMLIVLGVLVSGIYAQADDFGAYCPSALGSYDPNTGYIELQKLNKTMDDLIVSAQLEVDQVKSKITQNRLNLDPTLSACKGDQLCADKALWQYKKVADALSNEYDLKLKNQSGVLNSGIKNNCQVRIFEAVAIFSIEQMMIKLEKTGLIKRYGAALVTADQDAYGTFEIVYENLTTKDIIRLTGVELRYGDFSNSVGENLKVFQSILDNNPAGFGYDISAIQNFIMKGKPSDISTFNQTNDKNIYYQMNISRNVY